MRVHKNVRSCSTGCAKDELELCAFCRMKLNSFFIKFLLCLFILAVVLMQVQITTVFKQFKEKYIMSKNFSVNISVAIRLPGKIAPKAQKTKQSLVLSYSGQHILDISSEMRRNHGRQTNALWRFR